MSNNIRPANKAPTLTPAAPWDATAGNMAEELKQLRVACNRLYDKALELRFPTMANFERQAAIDDLQARCLRVENRLLSYSRMTAAAHAPLSPRHTQELEEAKERFFRVQGILARLTAQDLLPKPEEMENEILQLVSSSAHAIASPPAARKSSNGPVFEFERNDLPELWGTIDIIRAHEENDIFQATVANNWNQLPKEERIKQIRALARKIGSRVACVQVVDQKGHILCTARTNNNFSQSEK